jgi:hypothetical protein
MFCRPCLAPRTNTKLERVSFGAGLGADRSLPLRTLPAASSRSAASRVRLDRSVHWFKVKNPAAPAVGPLEKKFGHRCPERLFRRYLRRQYDSGSCLIVKDASGLAAAYVYRVEERGQRAAANLMSRGEARASP